MRDPPESENGSKAGKREDAGLEKAAAGRDFGRSWFVLRRHAAHGVGNHAILEHEAIIGGGPVLSGGQTYFKQS